MNVAAALAVLSTFAPLPSPMPAIEQQPCPDTQLQALACTDGQTIYLGPGLRIAGPYYSLEALAHELGHVWADQHPAALERFAVMVNVGPIARVPAGERFADTYAFCALGPQRRAQFRRKIGDLYGTYGERITRRVVANTCWLLRHSPIS